MLRTEDKIMATYLMRKMIAQEMHRMADIMESKECLDKKFDAEIHKMYHHMAHALENQIELEKMVK